MGWDGNAHSEQQPAGKPPYELDLLKPKSALFRDGRSCLWVGSSKGGPVAGRDHRAPRLGREGSASASVFRGLRRRHAVVRTPVLGRCDEGQRRASVERFADDDSRCVRRGGDRDRLSATERSPPFRPANRGRGRLRVQGSCYHVQMSNNASSSRIARWIPVVQWLRSYDKTWFRGDVVAAITLAAYLLPAALGDASLASLPPQAGLYACLFGGLVFWLFCSSRHTVVTVTSAISLLIGSSLGEMSKEDPARFAALAADTALLVALLGFLAWLVKAGGVVNFISESVMVGFKCGVALFLASTQLPKLFGFHGEHGDFWVNSAFFLRHLAETNPASLQIGLIALAILILGKIFLKNKPVALFVVVGGIAAAAWLGLDERGVKLLGEVPRG